MEFFGYSHNNEFSGPIEVLIKSATEPELRAPDWSINMEICDAVNNALDGVEIAVNCLTRRLKDKEHQTVFLAEIVAETCMKNCSKFAAGVQARGKPLMDELVQCAKGTKGRKAQEEGLRLIKQWQIMYSKNQADLPIFHEGYNYLRERGVVFPDSVDSVEPLPEQSTAPEMTQQEASRKLKSDLQVVIDKARLCRDMLPESPGIASDPALAEVVGFLEACRTRLMDLIEAGTMGMLEEDVLELALKTNDVVNKTLEAEMNGIAVGDLEDIDSIMKGGIGGGSGVSGAPTGVSSVQAVAFNMDDENAGLSVKSKKSKTPAEAGKPKFSIKPLPPPPGEAPVKHVTPQSAPTSIAETDIFAVGPAGSFAAPATKPADDFDLFFDSSPAPASAPSAGVQPPGTGPGVTAMTDDDFESFLSNLTISPKK